MKTEFEYKPDFHGDAGKLTGYVNLKYVAYYIAEVGELGFSSGTVKMIAKEKREEMAKALEEFDMELGRPDWPSIVPAVTAGKMKR